MVWPQNLVACTLLNTLHAEDEDDGIGMYGGGVTGTGRAPGSGGSKKGMTRFKFFLITMSASFFFFFLPGAFFFFWLVYTMDLYNITFFLDRIFVSSVIGVFLRLLDGSYECTC